MIRKLSSFAIGLVAISQAIALAGEPIKHRIMVAEYADQHRLLEIDRDGKVTWEYAPPSLCVIFQPLANGHVVYAYGGNPTGRGRGESR